MASNFSEKYAHKDGEIDIFSADKYFSGRMDEGGARKANMIARRRTQESKSDQLHSTESKTPSVYSESSWNSQSILLSRPRDSSRNKAKATKKKKFLAHLSCNCACSDKNSVEVEEHHSSVEAVIDQEVERKSLEVFGSSKAESNNGSNNGSNKSFSLERRLSMLAWDAIPKVEEMEIQGPISAESIKDTESEGSSDLFEIECLSCSANPVALPRNKIEGGDSSCASPTTCYAPSEASVEWSIVTASAAEFSEEQGYRKMLPPRPRRAATELPKARYGGILSGCKSEKSVRVVGDFRPRAETPRIPKMMKFQMDSTQKVGLGSKYRKDVLYI